mgnify:FL=1
MVKNLFGDLGLDSTIKALKNVISRFTFDTTGQLRVGGNVGISSGTVTTVGTVSQSNGCIGDSGRTSAIMQNSSIMFNCSTRRNFI